jgi:hypothetical protein
MQALPNPVPRHTCAPGGPVNFDEIATGLTIDSAEAARMREVIE